MARDCLRCSKPIADRDARAYYCLPCVKQPSNKAQSMAHRAVRREVIAGRMPAASTQQCVDCGAQAYDWDHRDYSRPLEVEAVCRTCNQKRRPAKGSTAMRNWALISAISEDKSRRAIDSMLSQLLQEA